MSKRMSDEVAAEAATWLGAHDERLKPVIARTGLATFRPHTDYYQELVDSIISQQLSVKAAHAIEQRFRDMFGGAFPTPEQILTKDADQLRAIGFSYAKAKYVRDLAEKILAGEVQFDTIDSLSNEEVTKELIKVKGIGEWTTHMFLMFCMGRTDVLPVGDLGVKNGMKILYDLADPTPATMQAIAAQYSWHPYESIASWYVWQSLDNAPKL